MSLRNVLKMAPIPTPRVPLWKGPEEDGITFSMLSRFLTCRERFYVYAVEGLRPHPQFNHRIEYGQMWHECEEALAGGENWMTRLTSYCSVLSGRYPFSHEQIRHWYEVCRTQFPLYVNYWKGGKEKCRPVFQEKVFDVPYRLPSGRTVRLRGKWDSLHYVEDKDGGLYIQENKTKGDIDEAAVRRQLTFDLQTMLYVVAVRQCQEQGLYGLDKYHAVEGVRYNVVRRPLSGGKGSIRQGKTEAAADFYARLKDVIDGDKPYYFMRWLSKVTKTDVDRFRERCMDPLLEQVCHWYEAMVSRPRDRKPIPPHCLHYQHPFGVRNTLDEGGHTDLDEYLTTGSEVGLRRVDRLFEELT